MEGNHCKSPLVVYLHSVTLVLCPVVDDQEQLNFGDEYGISSVTYDFPRKEQIKACANPRIQFLVRFGVGFTRKLREIALS